MLVLYSTLKSRLRKIEKIPGTEVPSSWYAYVFWALILNIMFNLFQLYNVIFFYYLFFKQTNAQDDIEAVITNKNNGERVEILVK